MALVSTVGTFKREPRILRRGFGYERIRGKASTAVGQGDYFRVVWRFNPNSQTGDGYYYMISHLEVVLSVATSPDHHQAMFFEQTQTTWEDDDANLIVKHPLAQTWAVDQPVAGAWAQYRLADPVYLGKSRSGKNAEIQINMQETNGFANVAGANIAAYFRGIRSDKPFLGDKDWVV